MPAPLKAALPDESARGVPGEAPAPPPPRVAIVGGGLAGLACAVGLAELGLRITLYESRPRLGGRASSFTDPVTGALVDNCQHVSMSCCTNLADFCRRVGTANLFKVVDTIQFIGTDGRVSKWKAGPWPAPLHLAGAFLRSRFLTLGDKARVAYGLSRLRFATRRDSRSFEQWLRANGQNDRTIARFWGTVLVSALNERLDQTDIGHARKVFLDGMMRTRHGYRLEIPRVPLGELYGTHLESWLSARQVTTRLGCGVKQIARGDDGGVAGVRLRTGEFEPAEFIVLAVPFDRATDLLDEPTRALIAGAEEWTNFATSPITGIHLWFDREVCPVEHAVVIDRTVQWVFNHSKIQANAPEVGGQYLQLVVSAAYDLVGLDKEAILEIALDDLSALWPTTRDAKVVRSWVVTEHGATFSVRPGIDRIRPQNRTGIDGLVLAGDWTATGWPATMEGAVRSGYRAAEAISATLGIPKRLIQPDLPQGWLARLLLGRSTSTAHYQPTLRTMSPIDTQSRTQRSN